MNQGERKSTTGTSARAALARTLRSFFNLLPVIAGTLLLTSLAFTLIPGEGFKALFERYEILDVLLGAGMGSIAAGNPLAGYILGGELLAGGASLIAITAMIVSWVTVGGPTAGRGAPAWQALRDAAQPAKFPVRYCNRFPHRRHAPADRLTTPCERSAALAVGSFLLSHARRTARLLSSRRVSRVRHLPPSCRCSPAWGPCSSWSSSRCS